MKLNKGFTLIELMIVVAILGILAAVLIPAISGNTQRQSDGSKCKAGFKFVNDRQLIGPNGGGVPCDTISTPSAGPQPLK